MTAVDADVGDSVRIFVADTEGLFFNTNLGAVAGQPDCAASRGLVQPYLATRSGNNSAQTSYFALDGTPSIAAGFKQSIAFSPGSALQSILYTLRLGTGYSANPRPSTNRAVVVCGRAYDSSRRRYGRWVGLRRFDLSAGRYGFGDYESAERCWRVTPQAPPVILGVSVVSAAGVAYSPGFNGAIVVPAGTGDTLKITFSAADANAGDRTQVSVSSAWFHVSC